MCFTDFVARAFNYLSPSFVALASGVIGHFIVLAGLHLAGQKIKHTDNVGRWIGYLERILVTTFVLVGLVKESIFIFAIKAAVIGFRIPNNSDGDLKKRTVEYMLIGTMLSYLVALIFGFVGNNVLD